MTAANEQLERVSRAPPICSEPSTDELMLKVQQRDVRAFVQLYRRMLPAIKRQAASAGWQASAADDIAQEVFLRVWQNPDHFDGQQAANAYLLGISRNVMRELRKADAKAIPLADQLLSEPAIERDPAAAIERAGLMQALAAARSELSESQATALRMICDEKVSRRQAAKQLGCTGLALRLRLHAARRKLRQLLGGRVQLGISPTGLFGYIYRALANMDHASTRQPICRTASWAVMGIGAVGLMAFAPSERAREGQGSKHDSSMQVFGLPSNGEGASSAAEHIELQVE